MQNVVYKVERNKLLIEVSLSAEAIKKARPSQSGATFLIATSGGKIALPIEGREISFALNVMDKR